MAENRQFQSKSCHFVVTGYPNFLFLSPFALENRCPSLPCPVCAPMQQQLLQQRQSSQYLAPSRKMPKGMTALHSLKLVPNLIKKMPNFYIFQTYFRPQRQNQSYLAVRPILCCTDFRFNPDKTGTL